MEKIPLPEEERRGDAVRLACGVLLANEVRILPPDPAALAKEMDFRLWTTSELEKRMVENPDGMVRHSIGEEAFTLSVGGQYIIVYDDTVRSPERMRFSIFHEFGHVLMDHFRNWDVMKLTEDQARVLEDEANTFARNLICPPPILDLVRGDWRDPKWADLFCMSERAWKARVRTMPIDRRYIDQRTADRLRIQFREYMFGRRCRECGEVFTDDARAGRCPACGSRYLVWNPSMESRERAAARRHTAGATAEDLKPRVGLNREPDLTEYWKLTVKER